MKNTKKPISLLMRQAQKKAGGGRVTLTLASSGTYYAHAYRTPEQVQNATPRQVEAAGGSVTLAQLDQIRQALAEQAFCASSGKTAEDALADLAGKIEIGKEAGVL